jgi:hypothetical protein
VNFITIKCNFNNKISLRLFWVEISDLNSEKVSRIELNRESDVSAHITKLGKKSFRCTWQALLLTTSRHHADHALRVPYPNI